MTEELALRLHENVVGRIRRGPSPAQVRLSIDPAYDATGVTLSESFASVPGTSPKVGVVSRFLGGYVPEGYHRTVMASRRGVDPSGLFGLLREYGGSLAGAVTLTSDSGARGADGSGWLEQLSSADLAERLRQAVRETDQAVPTDSRSTLPGFQPKMLAFRTREGWAQPHGAAHSTHILKPQVAERATRLVDEYYAHLLARRAGLAAYGSELLEADGVTFLAIERFDRVVGSDGHVGLVHQEDMAQALGLDWQSTAVKFQDLHRPDNPAHASATRVARLLSTVPRGSELLNSWVQRFVFSLILGDNDAHAKNIALLHTAQGTSLAPVYDVVPNLFQRDMIDEGFRMAFAVRGSFDHRQVTRDSIVDEVTAWPSMTPTRAAAQVDAAMTVCGEAVAEVSPPDGLSEGLVDKVHTTVERLSAGDPIGVSPWQKGSRRQGA